jgi:hypothetical protein
MADFLLECDYRSRRPAVVQWMMRGSNAKYEEDMKIMNDLANESADKFIYKCCLRQTDELHSC